MGLVPTSQLLPENIFVIFFSTLLTILSYPPPQERSKAQAKRPRFQPPTLSPLAKVTLSSPSSDMYVKQWRALSSFVLSLPSPHCLSGHFSGFILLCLSLMCIHVCWGNCGS